MTEERTTPLRERMIDDDMRIPGLGDNPQHAHIRAINQGFRRVSEAITGHRHTR